MKKSILEQFADLVEISSTTPSTDEEVAEMIRDDYSGDERFKDLLLKVYHTRRSAGDSVDDALIFTLRWHVGVENPDRNSEAPASTNEL
jgi:hypothetical protein